VPIAASASGFVATHQPATVATATHASMTPTVHQRSRYSAAGSDSTTNRRTSRQAGSCVPAIRDRARASSWDSRATASGSGAEDRMVDRSVAAAW
jgi:hypothetical protein